MATTCDQLSFKAIKLCCNMFVRSFVSLSFMAIIHNLFDQTVNQSLSMTMMSITHLTKHAPGIGSADDSLVIT